MLSRFYYSILFSLIFFIPISFIFAQSLEKPYTTAEWDEVSGLIVHFDEEILIQILDQVSYQGWKEVTVDFYKGYLITQESIIKAAIEEEINVYVLDDISNDFEIKDTLISHGISSPFIEIINYNSNEIFVSPWLRDNGPFTVYNRSTG